MFLGHTCFRTVAHQQHNCPTTKTLMKLAATRCILRKRKIIPKVLRKVEGDVAIARMVEECNQVYIIIQQDLHEFN